MTNEKHFPKTISQWEFDYGLFTNLPRIIVARDFSPSSFKRYPTSLDKTRTYPDLKTTCHIKLKFFLWTKLLENLTSCKVFLICRCDFNFFDFLIYSGRISIIKNNCFIRNGIMDCLKKQFGKIRIFFHLR